MTEIPSISVLSHDRNFQCACEDIYKVFKATASVADMEIGMGSMHYDSRKTCHYFAVNDRNKNVDLRFLVEYAT